MSGRVLITGASGAFGTAVRDAMRANGWSVAGLDLRADGGEVIACDITDPAAASAGVTEAIA